MRLFISAGEPAGNLHGANLARVLRERHPDVDLLGLGGDRMARTDGPPGASSEAGGGVD